MKKFFLSAIVLVVTLQLSAQYLDFSEYFKGYYQDNNGNKVYGYIQYKRGNNAHIKFRAQWDGKSKKILPRECSGFVFFRDSIRFIRVNSGFSVKSGIGMVTVSDDFVRVLDSGKVNLYLHYSASGSGTQIPGVVDWENPVIRKNDPSAPYIGLHPNLTRRRKELEEQLKGENELIEILCRKELSELRSGLQEYNSR